MFVDAIKKNRACQKFLRSKLIQIEARIEENKTLMQRVKLLKDFQVSCKKRTGLALSQKKDARVQLISAMKPRASSKVNGKKFPPLYYGPNENSHVANYRMVLTNFPISLNREKWSDEERENLTKGVKQQFQELLLQKSVDLFSEVEGGSGDANDLDTIIASIRDHDITPENIRSFLPRVNWKRLASIYVAGRSGAECEARWLNCEDPLINHHPWSKREDKELLHVIQQRGISDWIEIAVLLGTNRTPFQCLARYQRSLNASILKREWTQDDDDKLRAAVETFGESSWQLVAATLEGRTGTQCSNRWIKSLHPSRQKVGRWTLDEDKRLKVAVMLFGAKTWNKIAQFVPGRTHVQCRERWVNCLDPSLSFGGWTAEEDSKLDAAAVKHEYRWSKVAACLPHRTDNLCMRRWRDLHPMEWQSLRTARKIQNVALISNFVDRESERPALGPNDFIPLALTNAVSETEILNPSGKQKRKPRSKRPSKEAQSCSGEVLLLTNGNEAENNGGDDSISKRVMRPRSKKRNFEPTQDMTRTSQVGQPDWKTKRKRSFATRKRKFRGRPEEASMDVAIPEKERGMKSYSEENKHSDPTKAHLLGCADLDLLIMTNGEQVRELGGNYSANNRRASKQGQRRSIGVELQDESSGMINSDGITSFREIDAIFDRHGDATQVDSSLCPVSTSSNITNVNEVEDFGDDGARKNNAHKLCAKRTKYDRLMREVSEMTDSSKADTFGSNDARLKKKRVTDHSLKKCAGASHSPSSKSSTMSTPEVEDFGDDGARKNNAHKLRAKRTKYDRLMQEVSEMTDSSKADIFGSNDARLKKKRVTDHSLKKCGGASHSLSSKTSTMSDRRKRSRTTENTGSNHVLETEARDDMTLALFIEHRRKKRKLKLAETGNLVTGGICPLHESLKDHLEGVNVAGDDSSDPCSPPPGFENRIYS